MFFQITVVDVGRRRMAYEEVNRFTDWFNQRWFTLNKTLPNRAKSDYSSDFTLRDFHISNVQQTHAIIRSILRKVDCVSYPVRTFMSVAFLRTFGISKNPIMILDQKSKKGKFKPDPNQSGTPNHILVGGLTYLKDVAAPTRVITKILEIINYVFIGGAS